MSSLFTAFRGKLNTSFRLLSQLDTNKLFLTNSFSGLEKDIKSFTEKYDAVHMFGVDKGLDREVRINANKCGQNDCKPKTARVSSGFRVFIPKRIARISWMQNINMRDSSRRS